MPFIFIEVDRAMEGVEEVGEEGLIKALDVSRLMRFFGKDPEEEAKLIVAARGEEENLDAAWFEASEGLKAVAILMERFEDIPTEWIEDEQQVAGVAEELEAWMMLLEKMEMIGVRWRYWVGF